MKNAWQDADRNELLARIDRVNDSTNASWGTMTAAAMLAHLAQSMKMAVGELPCESKKLPIRYFPLKHLILYVFPFPKGAPTAPELLEGSDTPVATSKSDLHRLFAKFTAQKGSTWPEHPAFGTLNEKQWGMLTYKHLDHHLRQFGV